MPEPTYILTGGRSMFAVEISPDTKVALAGVYEVSVDTVQQAIFAAQCGDMEEANTLLKGFGVETVAAPDGSSLEYINNGESYDVSLCIERPTGNVLAISWGAWFEVAEEDYCRKTGEIPRWVLCLLRRIYFPLGELARYPL